MVLRLTDGLGLFEATGKDDRMASASRSERCGRDNGRHLLFLRLEDVRVPVLGCALWNDEDEDGHRMTTSRYSRYEFKPEPLW